MATNYKIFKVENWFNRNYDGRKKEFKGISKEEFYIAQNKAIRRRYWAIPCYDKSLFRRCYESVKEWAKPEHHNYQKVVMYGHTWLYLCSPHYGHRDYNKSRLMPIKGNERKCEFLQRVSNKVANVNP